MGELAGLSLALGLVFSVQFIPHLDTFDPEDPDERAPLVRLGGEMAAHALGAEDYPYPVHVDEHLHWVYAAQTQRFDRLVVGDAYNEDPPRLSTLGSLRGAVHERGFHLVLAQAQEMTGVPWHHFLEYLPAAWMAFIAFGVYALVRPHPAAVPAAAFVALVPTTVRFLGPAFLVPIGFGLAWLPVTGILAGPGRRRAGAAALVLLVVTWAFFVHLIAGFAAVIVLGLTGLLGAPRDRRAALTLLAIAVVPLAWLYRTFTADIEGELAREEALPIDFTIFDSWGLVTLALWGIGLALLVLVPPKRDRGPIAGFAGLSVVALTLIVGGVVLELGRYATYARWHPPFFLAAAVPAGHAVATIGLKLREGLLVAAQRLDRQALTRVVAPVALVLAVLVPAGLTLAAVSPAVDEHLDEPYYRVMNPDAYARYLHVASHVGPAYEVFLANPWQAPFLTALSGKDPHSVLLPGAPPRNDEDFRAYVQGRADLEMYILNDITLVVGSAEPPPPFERVGPDIWVLDESIARELAAIRAQERAMRASP